MTYNTIIYAEITDEPDTNVVITNDTWNNDEIDAVKLLLQAKENADGGYVRGFVLNFAFTPPIVAYELKSDTITKL